MSEPYVLEIVLIVILVVVCVAVGLLALQTLRKRRDRLRSEIDASKASLEERAFNRIHLGRSAADHLERSGVDVAGPRRLLDRASKEFDAGHHDDALALASSAHEALRKQASAPAPSPTLPELAAAAATAPAGSSPPPSLSSAMGPPMAADRTAEAAAPPPNRLPKNKAESHFQLRLLDEELGGGGPAGTPPATLQGVGGIASEAHASYDRGDFTEALRLALKGRRTLGARLETLPPSPSNASAEPAPAPASGPDACRQCGQPLRSGDKFCRGCGAAAGATRCARCGDALEASDQFCGRCGTPRPQ